MKMLFITLQAAQAQGGGMVSSLVMMLVIFAIFYFFMIRPQSQKAKKENAFRASLTPGSKVLTAGGIHAVVREVKETYAMVEIAQGVKIKVNLSAIFPSEDSGVSKDNEIAK